MTIELTTWLFIAVGCAILAVAYWSSLWFTVRHASRARRPVLWLTMSLIIRLSVITLLFYLLIRDGNWDRLLIAFISFVAVRTLFIHWLGPHSGSLNKRGRTPV